MINVTFVVAGNTPGAPPPDVYKAAAKRFAETYKTYPAGAEHRLFLVNSNGGLTADVAKYFDDIPHNVITYRGAGWDIGAHQFAAFTMPPEDWIMCFSSWAHFRREGWLRAFVMAREVHGDGLYGSTSSFERSPHIRGTGFFVRCGRIQQYPHGCNSREESFEFEYGPESLTQWCIQKGYGAWLVTPEKTVSLENSRKLNNIFRRGDQSNIWTYDKHTELFDNASKEEKIARGNLSDYNRAVVGLPNRLKTYFRKLWMLIWGIFLSRTVHQEAPNQATLFQHTLAESADNASDNP